MTIREGLTHTSTVTVAEKDTAAAMGSGDLPVFATPAMVALMENASMNAVADSLPEGCTTVGGRVDVRHLRPSRIGSVLSATARLTGVDGRKLTFAVTVADEAGTTVGEADHVRFVVDRNGFMQKL